MYFVSAYFVFCFFLCVLLSGEQWMNEFFFFNMFFYLLYLADTQIIIITKTTYFFELSWLKFKLKINSGTAYDELMKGYSLSKKKTTFIFSIFFSAKHKMKHRKHCLVTWVFWAFLGHRKKIKIFLWNCPHVSYLIYLP